MTKDEKIEIERKVMKKFMNYFKDNRLDFNDTQLLQRMQESIARIFQLEVEEMGYNYSPSENNAKNTIELNFVNDINGWYKGFCNSYSVPPTITYNIAHLYKDLQDRDVDKRLFACKNLYRIVFHELQHHRQHLMVRTNVSSRDGLRYARDFALMRYLQKKWYRDVNERGGVGNYDSCTIENNANEVGYRQYLETIGSYDETITDLMNIEKGKLYTSRYKSDVSSWDGKMYYTSNGLQERDDVTVPILDDLICVRGGIKILKYYPILQKEYNLDGTKKTAVELIKNMQQEMSTISKNQALMPQERAELMKDGQEMYYDLIYRQLEKSTPEQLNQIVTQIGKEGSKRILSEISHFFQRELAERINASAKMATAQERMGKDGFIMPDNGGKISVEQDGKIKQMSFDEFINTIDPKLLQKNFDIPAGKDKGEMTAKKFVEKYFFDYLPPSGEVTLANGQIITAKQYIEQYVLTINKLRVEKPPYKIITETMKLDDPWKIHNENFKRLEQYYDKKEKNIAQISLKIDKSDLSRRKMSWINEYIKDYDETESNLAYDYRKEHEGENIKKVLESVKAGKFEDGFNVAEVSENHFSMYVGTMARLIKAAKSLTIDGGVNYLEKFTDIPEVNEILLKIKDSNGLKHKHIEAEKNRKNGTIPKYKETLAEMDRRIAQEYLESNNLVMGSVQKEIDYRRRLTANNLLKISDETERKDIPMLTIQQISLSRVLARQDGKTPSKSFYDQKRKGWFCFTNTNLENKLPEDQSVPGSTSTDTYGARGLSIVNIVNSTIRVGTGMNDINEVSEKIIKTQEKNLQRSR